MNSTDLKTSIQAMAQIDEVIKDQDVRSQLLTYLVSIVAMITKQLNVTLVKLSENDINNSEITDMFNGMFASLLSIFRQPDLASQLDNSGLKNLLNVIMTLEINGQLSELSERIKKIRFLILESSNQTRLLSSLLWMMMDCLRKEGNKKYLQLILECIQQMTNNLELTANSIDLCVILRDIHTFFTDFRPQFCTTHRLEISLRIVKAVICSIITHRGTGVLEALYQIPNARGKDLDQYIRELYPNLRYPIPNVVPQSNKSEYQNELMEIFHKICGISQRYSTTAESLMQQLQELIIKAGLENDDSSSANINFYKKPQ